jgi:GTP diphosphokinase / guanosine-3',5'-bis(diphosphate) 3'-diphosphatase
MKFSDLAKKILRYNKQSNITQIEEAYLFAKDKKKGRTRYSEQKEIEHNLEVAAILVEMRAGDKTIISGLLHNILDDKEIKEIEVKEKFGEVVLNTLKVTKKGQSPDPGEYKDPSSFRKLLLASMKDAGVLLIKIADKLSSLRTVGNLPNRQQGADLAKECLNIYAPIAHRIGLGNLKQEMEDLAFKELEPQIYGDLLNKIKDSKDQREIRARKILKIFQKKFGERFEFEGRAKHIYSIYKKIQERGYLIERMMDFIGIRILTDTEKECYEVLDFIRDQWKIVPGTLKDYVSFPKKNGYRSIHVVILDGGLRLVELQLRTKKMHEFAEQGVAAHTLYKGVGLGKKYDKKLDWLKEIINSIPKDGSFDTRSINLFKDTIFVITPNGDVIELPEGANIIDFAYAVHTNLGHTATGAFVNEKYVALKSKLKNGDVVNITSNKNKKPSSDSIFGTVTNRAVSRIKSYLVSEGKIVPGNKFLAKEEHYHSLIEADKHQELEILYCKDCNLLPGRNFILELKQKKYQIAHELDCKKVKCFSNPQKGKWKEINNQEITIILVCCDRVGLFSDLLNIFSSQGMNLKNVSADSNNNSAICNISLSVKSLSELTGICYALNKIKDMKKIYVKI